MAGTANPLIRGFKSHPDLLIYRVDFGFYLGDTKVVPRDPRGGYNRKNVNENFFKVWNPHMSYVLGFMFADGSLIDSNMSSRTYYLSFTNNQLYLLEAIRNLMKSEHNIYLRSSRVMSHKRKRYISKDGYVLRIGNKNMYQDLCDLGMQHRKSNIMVLPNVPDEYFSYYLRGYFDGDGCVNISLYGRKITPQIKIIFSSGSLVYLRQLSCKLAALLTINKPHIYKSCGAYNLTARGFTAIKILEYMYQNLNTVPYLCEKYIKYINFRKNSIGPRIKRALLLN